MDNAIKIETTTKAAYETKAAALKVADAAYYAKVRAFAKGMARKACCRCGGCGTVRLASGASGDCFRCGGSGEELAKRADVKALAAYRAACEVDRLRACWRAQATLVKSLTAILTEAAWYEQHTLEIERAALARIEAAGKAAAKSAAT